MTTLTSKLDNTASEIVSFQRDSTVQRKELAQKTKEFRKMDDATKLTEVKGLLKGTEDTPGSVYLPFHDSDHCRSVSELHRCSDKPFKIRQLVVPTSIHVTLGSS